MVQWEITEEKVDYETALAKMDNHVEKMIQGEAGEKIWLLEHPPLYTAGTSADRKTLSNLIDFLFLKQSVAANTRITGLANELFM